MTVRTRGLDQVGQRIHRVGEILASLPEVLPEQGGDNGAGYVVLIAGLPRDIRPAEHTEMLSALHLHLVKDEGLGILEDSETVLVPRPHVVHHVRAAYLPRTVGAELLNDGLVAVPGGDVMEQTLPHSVFPIVKQNICPSEPGQSLVHRRGDILCVSDNRISIVAADGRRESRGDGLSREERHDVRDHCAPRFHGSQPGAVEVAQAEGGHQGGLVQIP